MINSIYGGGDNDTFQINKGSSRALITDYDCDADSVELLGRLTESDLTYNYARGDKRIKYGDDLPAIVQNTIAENITFFKFLLSFKLELGIDLGINYF